MAEIKGVKMLSNVNLATGKEMGNPFIKEEKNAGKGKVKARGKKPKGRKRKSK